MHAISTYMQQACRGSARTRNSSNSRSSVKKTTESKLQPGKFSRSRRLENNSSTCMQRTLQKTRPNLLHQQFTLERDLNHGARKSQPPARSGYTTIKRRRSRERCRQEEPGACNVPYNSTPAPVPIRKIPVKPKPISW
jgi:hypothetical protein